MNGSTGIRPRLALALAGLLFSLPPGSGAQAPEDLHTFTSADGKTLEAEVVDFRDAKVVIRRLTDGQTFELPANRLSPPDVEFMRGWLKAREASAHPAGWTRLRIHLPRFADKVEAPGIPEAFQRADLTQWEAELPKGAWVLVKIWPADAKSETPLEFLLPYGGEREWHLSLDEARLIRKATPTERGVLVGLHVRPGDDEAALRALKSAIPDGGVALYSDFLDGADLTAFGSGGVLSFVCEKVNDFTLASQTGVRAVRVTSAAASFDGLAACGELESLEARHSGEFPLAVAGKLKNLTTLVVSGDAELASATGKSDWALLRHLSFADAEITDPEALGAFLAGVPSLQSLILPDLQELEVAGLGQCRDLTALALGDECYDPDAAGIGALEKLSIALLNDLYDADELASLTEKGRFGKVRAFRTASGVDFARLPQLRLLMMLGDQDAFDMASLRGIGRPFALDAASLVEADLAGFAAVAADLRITSLTLRYPNVPALDPLPPLPDLAFLRLENQLVTFDQKITTLDFGTRFPGLRGIEVNRLQSLESLTLAGDRLAEVFALSCDELTKISLPTSSAARVLAVRCPKLTGSGNP